MFAVMRRDGIPIPVDPKTKKFSCNHQADQGHDRDLSAAGDSVFSHAACGGAHQTYKAMFCLLVLMHQDGFFICERDHVGLRVLSMR